MHVLRCGHCGREGFMDEVQDLKLVGKTVVARSDTEEDVEQQQRLVVMRCTRCDEVTLLRYTYYDEWSKPGDFDGLRTVYPEARDVEDLPDRVQERYGKMLELAYEPDAFAMRAGKVLEAICNDQGYPKGNLGPRLDKLIADDRLPPALGDQAHLVREYRNIGSHGDGSLDVEAEDVPLIRDFVESLLDYLYWGPAKLQRVKDAIEKRQNQGLPGEPAWKALYHRMWRLLKAVEDAGGDVSASELSKLARENGDDPRGLGGFYVGDKPSLRREDKRRIITEDGRAYLKEWASEFGK